MPTKNNSFISWNFNELHSDSALTHQSHLCPIPATYPQVLAQPSRFTCQRNTSNANNPAIVYYFNKPTFYTNSYPIVMLCEGSSSKDDLVSVMFMHTYFGDPIDELHCGLLMVEKWGIDGATIHEKEFWEHYTRSQRFNDHITVIKHFEHNPPEGWDGTFIFIGVSEGGPLVDKLSITYSKTRATIKLVGAGSWNWADELWEFFTLLREKHWFISWIYDRLPKCFKWYGHVPTNRAEYNVLLEHIKQNRSPTARFGGMTYLYHADALEQQHIDCTKIYAPMRVVMGTLDPAIASCDDFVRQARIAHAPVTYLQVEEMDH